MREPFDGARSTLNCLFYIECLQGVAIAAVTTFYLFQINAFFGAKEQKVILGQLLHFHVLGLVVILVSVVNLQLWKRLWNLPTFKSHIIMFLNLWLCFNTFVLLCGLGTLWCVGQCATEAVAMAETALMVGMDKYFEFPEWKLRWDELQINQQCCGVLSFKDWQTAIWMSYEDFSFSGSNTLAPYSCCRGTDSVCYRMDEPDIGGNLPILPLEVINKNGCVPIFKHYLQNLINFLWIALLSALFFQLCIWFLVSFIVSNQNSRFGQDYSRNAENKNLDDFENQKNTME